MIYVCFALIVVIVIQGVLRSREVEAQMKERDRLSRLAFAETKAERITALLPERPLAERPARTEPPKPIGL